MARGLDKEEVGAPTRRNPFRQKITGSKEEIEEKRREGEKAREAKAKEEAELDQEVEKLLNPDFLKEEGYTEEEIEYERTEIRERLIQERAEKVLVENLKDLLKEKEEELELERRQEYLLSLGLEDPGNTDKWQAILAGLPGLLETDYQINVALVDDEYLKAKGRGYAFTLTYSPKGYLAVLKNAGLLRDRQVEAQVLDIMNEEGLSLDSEKDLEKALEKYIEQESDKQEEDPLAQGLAASQEEARRLAEVAIQEQVGEVFERAREQHSLYMEEATKQRELEEEKRWKEEERRRAEAKEESKKKETLKTFAGLEWGDLSNEYVAKKINHLIKHGRDFKREKTGDCEVVTFYEDDLGYYEGDIRRNTIGGAIFYQGKLKAIIKESKDGAVLVVPEEFEDSAWGPRRITPRDRGEAVLVNSRWNKRRRGKRKRGPEKIRREVEEKIKGYVDRLIEEEALKKLS